jgi:hypothetical protein
LGWWRFGDDDSGLAVPPTDGGAIGPGSAANQRTVNHSGSLDGMYFSSGQPQYSTAVPGTGVFTPPKIYEPISDTKLDNAWSMRTPGAAATERLRPGSVDVPTTFTFETFVQPISGTGATGTLAFAYHRSSGSNGWQLTRNSNGSVTAELFAGGTSTNSITSATGLLPNDVWHHVAVVYQNLTGTDNDFFLYVDYNLVAQGNGTVSPSGNTTFFVGNATSSSAKKISMDEARYFDNSSNPVLDPANFLHVVPEPNALILASIGVVGLAGYRVRRRNAKS